MSTSSITRFENRYAICIRVRSSVSVRPRFRHVRYDWQVCIFGTTGVKSYLVIWVCENRRIYGTSGIYWLLSPSVLIIIFEWHRQSPSPSPSSVVSIKWNSIKFPIFTVSLQDGIFASCLLTSVLYQMVLAVTMVMMWVSMRNKRKMLSISTYNNS